VSAGLGGSRDGAGRRRRRSCRQQVKLGCVNNHWLTPLASMVEGLEPAAAAAERPLAEPAGARRA